MKCPLSTTNTMHSTNFGDRNLDGGEMGVQKYKTEQRKLLIEGGYRIWGVVGDQWSSLLGFPNGRRTFKLPNSLYYVA